MSIKKDKTESQDVVFYQLSVKFVDSDREIPEKSREVLYYSLQIGHHTGIIDCLTEKIRCTYGAFIEIVEALPQDSVPRYKLEGIIRHGEIQIDKTHLGSLDPAIKDLVMETQASSPACSEKCGQNVHVPGEAGRFSITSQHSFSEEAKDFLLSFSNALDAIREQPGVYLMGRLAPGR